MAHVSSARGRAAMAGDGAGHAGRWPRARARRRDSSAGSGGSASERRSRVRERGEGEREGGSGRAAAAGACRRRGKHPEAHLARLLNCERVEVRWHGMLTSNSETKEKALGTTVKADIFIGFSFLSLYSLNRGSWRGAKIWIFCTKVEDSSGNPFHLDLKVETL